MYEEDKDARPDRFLERRLARTDEWVREGRISFSSRVIPVGESLTAQQWVLPGAQVLDVLESARSFALAHCICRRRYHRCNNPTEVCFLLDDDADQAVAGGRARRISIEEAATVLQSADERGLVHLAIYEPEHHVSALCSCCTCCCHDLQFLKRYGRPDLIAHSEYVAATNMAACSHCGDCIARCPFGARVWEGSEMRYEPAACFGCGLCVTACTAGATILRPRPQG